MFSVACQAVYCRLLFVCGPLPRGTAGFCPPIVTLAANPGVATKGLPGIRHLCHVMFVNMTPSTCDRHCGMADSVSQRRVGGWTAPLAYVCDLVGWWQTKALSEVLSGFLPSQVAASIGSTLPQLQGDKLTTAGYTCDQLRPGARSKEAGWLLQSGCLSGCLSGWCLLYSQNCTEYYNVFCQCSLLFCTCTNVLYQCSLPMFSMVRWLSARLGPHGLLSPRLVDSA